MSVAESGEFLEGGNTFRYAEIAPNINRVNIGDAVHVEDFTKYDDVVTSLVRIALSTAPGIGELGFLPQQTSIYDRPRPVVPVTGKAGLNNKGVPVYRDWIPNLTLPSAVLRPKNHHGKVLNATVSILGASIDTVPDRPTERSLDLLLSADLHVTGRGIVSRQMARLLVERTGLQKPRGNYKDLSKSDAAEQLRILQMESVARARLIEAIRMSSPTSYGGGGLGHRRD